MLDPNIKARLVCDGNTLLIPPEMGTPSPEQMQGTLFERLSELCCRVCYDSLGKGRTSPAMHEHLLDVGHWSVYEHMHWTVSFPQQVWGDANVFLALLNRPELRVIVTDRELRITLNARHLLDWDRWSKLSGNRIASQKSLFDEILAASKDLAPAIFKRLSSYYPPSIVNQARLVMPEFAGEKFVTLFLSGSRGMSHEQVRHRFNISQRSTRYVDESGSPIIEHPLITAYAKESGDNIAFAPDVREYLMKSISEVFGTRNLNLGQSVDVTKHVEKLLRNIEADMSHVGHKRAAVQADCADLYDHLVEKLQNWLIARGVDKFTARKQARGAARNDLGNGLLTELMFTASIDMWDAMIGLRASIHADAEIRNMFTADEGVIASLCQSQYGQHFRDKWELVPSPDGLGRVAQERQPVNITPGS